MALFISYLENTHVLLQPLFAILHGQVQKIEIIHVPVKFTMFIEIFIFSIKKIGFVIKFTPVTAAALSDD